MHHEMERVVSGIIRDPSISIIVPLCDTSKSLVLHPTVLIVPNR